jgi:adenylate cyclase
MSDVFVSYARSNEEQAIQVAEALRGEGYGVWRDDELPAHRAYGEVIEERLKLAKAVVVLWSADAAKSQWVRAEADAARGAGSLVQATLDGLVPPLPFNQIQCADLKDWDGDRDAPGWRKLAASVSALTKLGDASSGAQLPPKTHGKRSICVLPFANMSGDPEQEYFSDGISEDITTDLSKISALDVVARNTAFTFKGRSVDVPQIADRLGVSHVLEGSVRKAGGRVRITAQLIDGRTGHHAWADRFDRELTDIFAIQDEISKAIVEALKVKLLPAERRAIAKRGTSNIEAYEYYLKGRQFFHNTTRSYLALARRMFEKAIELDPEYARAYAGIASCDTRLNEWYAGGISTDAILAVANKALAIDSGLAEAYAARAAALADAEQPHEAEAAFKEALAIDPESYDAVYAFARFRMARAEFAEAAELYIRAFEIQPDDYQAPLLAVSSLQMIGRNEEAERYARIGLQHAREALRLHPESSRPAQLGACVLASLGETEEAREWLARALAVDPEDNGARYNAACCLAQIGEPEQALELLERWVEHRGSEGRRWILVDPDFESLRTHPRFRALAHQ